MEFRYVPIFAMALVLAVGATRHVALPAEMYWTSVFPNTPMPKALQNLLIPPAAAGNHMKAALANMIKRYKGILIPRYVTAYRIYENAAGNSKQEFGDGNMATNKDVFFFESKLRPESKILKKTIEDCETPTIEGEEKFCATSLESFVDFGVSKLGKDIQLLSAELEKETQNPVFSIGDQGVKLMGKSEIVCHKMDYAYAVFFCHSIAKTDVYRVPLVGADGTRATILAICHEDSSAWSVTPPTRIPCQNRITEHYQSLQIKQIEISNFHVIKTSHQSIILVQIINIPNSNQFA
ncbi:hypothetical protein ES332_D05G078600v1 [Gossypium tomentosum]|uniref:BURP domain-containing protein n=1 Tax=Gossypium tomentosum TaxID=34277 RepID=A0A5D2KRN1_GOSTO|nr:hypothetical protein ES332_D05G078600v1 [Gossypium tomentosum]